MTVKRKFNRLKGAAWREFTGDVRTTGRRLQRAGTAFIRVHPVIALGGAAAVGALAVSHSIPKPGVARLLQIARFLLAAAFRRA